MPWPDVQPHTSPGSSVGLSGNGRDAVVARTAGGSLQGGCCTLLLSLAVAAAGCSKVENESPQAAHVWQRASHKCARRKSWGGMQSSAPGQLHHCSHVLHSLMLCATQGALLRSNSQQSASVAAFSLKAVCDMDPAGNADAMAPTFEKDVSHTALAFGKCSWIAQKLSRTHGKGPISSEIMKAGWPSQ